MMNGNQSEQNNSRTNVLSSFADSSINVRNPPLDNLNPSAYSTNVSSLVLSLLFGGIQFWMVYHQIVIPVMIG